MIERKVLQGLLRRRFSSLKRRCLDLRIDVPPITLYSEQLVDKILSGPFICHYCSSKLTLNPDSHHLLSIDHIIPLSIAPDNTIENLVECCHRCNLAKGVISYGTFIALVRTLQEADPELLEAVLNENFQANKANKIERRKAERDAA